MVTRRRFLEIGAAATLVPAAARADPAAADAQFYALLDGLKDDGPAPGLPSDVAAARARQSADLARLRAFDPAPLTFDARLDYDGIAEGLGLEAALRARFGFGTVGATVSPYVVSPRSGTWLLPMPVQNSVEGLVVKGFENERIQADAAQGVVPPDFILDSTLAKLSALREAAPDPLTLAIDEQIVALKQLRPKASHDAGVWRLPKGDTYYALALQIGTSLAIAPEAAHRAGLQQVAELSARADSLLKARGLTQGSVGARLHALAQDARYLYSDDEAGRAQAVADMNARLARVRTVLGQAFSGLSAGAILVRRAGPGRIGYREAPSYDGTRPGAYYVDLRDIRRRPNWSLPTVVHHETLPGHLLQLPLQEHADPPPLRLRYTPNAFFEGWAIYAEQLADELGLLQGDDLGRLGLLQSLLVRAARLVIDTGIHFKRWSREEAIARFFAIAGDAPDSLENEVDRIVVQPGLTAGPALGFAAIARLREAAKARGHFDPASFHAALLKRGAMRLSLLDSAMAPPG